MKKYDIIITVILVVMLIFGLIAIFWFNRPQAGSPEFDYLKNYQDNEYMPVYISEEKMAKMYYNDYMYYLTMDQQTAYSLLNEEYKNKRFTSHDAFKEFILPYSNYTLESYSVEEKKDKKIFYIRLSDSHQLIFATAGVMKYEVYFDEITIPIE